MNTLNIILCPDILLEVLSHLSPGKHGHFVADDEATRTRRFECRRALAACAIVSKAMSHHALNALWTELDTLHPILQLLPGYRRRSGSPHSTICGAISTESWTRLQSYARRVRCLTVSRHTLIHPSVWSFLAKCCAGAPLFPRLHDLEVQDIPEYHIGLLLLVLCPSLREVSVSFKPGPTGGAALPDVVSSLLENLTLTAPQLEFLCLFGDHTLDPEHLLHLKRFGSMVEMGLSDHFTLDEAVLHALSTIPTLRILNATLRLQGVSSGEALDFGDGFRALNHLGIKGTSKDLSRVITALSRSELDCLTLEFTDSVSADMPDARLAAIAAHLPDTITQYSSTFCALLNPLPLALADLLCPLLSKMPKLEDFSLFAEKSPLSVTNDDLVRLGDAWPHLVRLNVQQWSTQFNLKDVRRPDVSGLADLAKRCPRLEMISLPELDVSKAAEPRAVPFLDHHLEQLLFQSASIAPARAQHEAAVAIDIMFPHLELHEMQPRALPPSRLSPQWVHIWKTLEIMRWGRESYVLSETGCESTVPEVPEMPSGFDRDDR